MDEWDKLHPLTGVIPPFGRRSGNPNRNDMIVEYPQHLKAAKELAERTIVRLQAQHQAEQDLTKSDRYIGVLNNLLMSMAKLGVEMRHWLKLQEKHEAALDVSGKLDVMFKYLTGNKVTLNERLSMYRKLKAFEDTRSGKTRIELQVSQPDLNKPPSGGAEPADDK